MKKIEVDELKLIQLDIMQKVHDFCVDNNIKYFLSSGTLIGAVRHGGYIPWDDDIDIYMPRLDYDAFVKSYYISPKDSTRVRSLETDDDYHYAFAKVEDTRTSVIEKTDTKLSIGVNIDIFPIDGVPEDDNARAEYFKEIANIRKLEILKSVSIDWKRRGPVKNIILIMSKILLAGKSQRYLAKRLDNAIKKNLTDTSSVCNMPAGNGLKSCFRRSAMAESIDITFEGRTFKTMKGYDEYLKATFGDYMKLPPESQRVSHHAFTAYWK